MTERAKNAAPESGVVRAVGYVKVPAEVADVVQRFIRDHGERAALEHFNLSRVALARAAAGLTCQRGTLLALRDGVARIKASKEAE